MAESVTLREWLGRDRGLIALVFTDIVDSTAIGLSMAEDDWVKILMKHFERARAHKKPYDGYEVKLIGDACMIAFPTPAQALDFAVKFFEDTGDQLISIKVGIHFGSVQVVENDIYGLMVNYTARVQHALKACGIAVSKAVRTDLKVLGPDLGGRGEVKGLSHDGLKGFGPEDQELWEIVTRGLYQRRREDRIAQLARSKNMAKLSTGFAQRPPVVPPKKLTPSDLEELKPVYLPSKKPD